MTIGTAARLENVSVFDWKPLSPFLLGRQFPFTLTDPLANGGPIEAFSIVGTHQLLVVLDRVRKSVRR